MLSSFSVMFFKLISLSHIYKCDNQNRIYSDRVLTRVGKIVYSFSDWSIV